MGEGLDKTSVKRLRNVHPDLVRLARAAHEDFPLLVVCGHRGKEEQDAAFAAGLSKVKWPTSKHNKIPSLAVDLAPLPLDWSNRKAFEDLAAHVLQVAEKLGIEIRWGGDWNRNGSTKDERFLDYPHFELVGG